MKYRDVIRLVEEDGWRLRNQEGSHRQAQTPDQAWEGDDCRTAGFRRTAWHVEGYPEKNGAGQITQYAIVIERGETSWGAYVPDLPGCAAVAETEDEVRELIRESIRLHIKAMLEDGDPIPEPTSKVECVALPLAS